MKLMFELSKEHTTLPSAEAIACLEAEGGTCSIVTSNEDVLVVDIASNDVVIQRLAQRLAFSSVIDELLFFCPATLDDIVQNATQHPLTRGGSIAIRCNNRLSAISSKTLIDRLGGIYTKNRVVNLVHPDIELRAVLTKTTAYVGVKKATIATCDFQQRRGHLRPFLSPVTLHPKIARALVNLTKVKKQETLLDPFCGTGGILLEAGLLGINVIGSDIEEKMIDGCRKNLEFYGLKNHRLYCTDIGDIPRLVPSVDAIVTDFPYARATTTKGEQLTHLYTRAFETIAQMLKKNGRAVVGLSSEEIHAIGERYLSVVKTYPIKAHRSLTRYFVVYINQ
jgi:tRNA (guanine10-N2)-dimethyltransferase